MSDRFDKRFAFLSLLGLSAVLGGLNGSARAEEGMWTFDHLPAAKIKSDYGFTPTQAWADHLTKASARLSMGCSASFVSGDGLVMTNHHCAVPCLSDLSDKKHDYFTDGFYSRTPEQERRCPGLEIDRLDHIEDVTDKVAQVTAGKEGADYDKALEGYKAQATKDCVQGDSAHWRCDAVTLFHGGRVALYRYRRYNDIRLVTAPEEDIAQFGGDPDNFTFPRYDLDYSFMRAYENGAPVHTDYLKFNSQGPKAGQTVFTSGNPGHTQRELTVDQLVFDRDVANPRMLQYLNLREGMLWEYGNQNAENRRVSQDSLFFVQNSLKAIGGMRGALIDPDFIAKRAAEDLALRNWISKKKDRSALYGTPFEDVKKAVAKQRALSDEAFAWSVATRSGALSQALALVAAAQELSKPDAQRQAGFHDSQLEALKGELTAPTPYYPQFEAQNLALNLTYVRQLLGPYASVPQLLIGKNDPDKLAQDLTSGTKLGDAKIRAALFAGGAKAIETSNDPMIVYARKIYPALRDFKDRYRAEVEVPLLKAGSAIGRARFAYAQANKRELYPDATFSPRLSYGRVLGWTNAQGKQIAPFTTIAGMYDHATGEQPFKLPESWIKAKPKLDLKTNLNLVSTNDIIGGNSGSPLINEQGEAVGLIFDGNLEGLVGNYYYDIRVNRAVSVDTAAIKEALSKVYGENGIVKELEKGKR